MIKFNLLELRDLTQDALAALWRKIDLCPSDQLIPIGPCVLPPGCTPSEATALFLKQGTQYCMALDRPVRYIGDNRAMQILCSNEILPFDSYPEMALFFRYLPAPTPRTPVSPVLTPAHSYDLDAVVDMDKVSVPAASAAKPTPDTKAIQQELEKVIIGQEAAVAIIAHHAALHIKKKSPKKPLSVVAYGPPGTGKSEMAKSLANILSRLGPHQYSVIWNDLNTFTEAHSIHRLIGAPPGYAGYDDTPVFEEVTKNPYTVFIWDELDKAHEMVLKTFMGILDEGRCASKKELADGSRFYDFRHSIHIFTSNFVLGASQTKKKTLGFAASSGAADIGNDGAVTVSQAEAVLEEDAVALTQRIYRNTESARKAFIDAGVLREIASRFSCFVEFKELSDEAKVRILAKQVIETGLEYDVQLTHISSEILQALINASTSENALTVRSFKAVIEGYLAAAFAEAGAEHGGQPVRLEGTLEVPAITPA